MASAVILTTSDIQNQASYKAQSVGINLGNGFDPTGALTPQGTSAGIGQDSGNARSTTVAAISGIAGNNAARTGEAQTGIQQIFDADKVQKDINAQVLITQTFGREASKAVGDYASNKAKELRAQGNEEEARKWDEGGTYRSLAHAAIGGLTGGASGAAGAGAAALSADAINQVTADLPAGVISVVGAAIAAGIGAAAGGGNLAGALTALNEDLNNRQLHLTEAQKLDALKRGKTKEQQDRLNAAACALVHCADGVADSDPNKAQLLSMQTEGANYTVEQNQLRATGEFVYRSGVDWANDSITRNGEITQRVGGAVNLAAGSVAMVGGSVITAGGVVSCAQTVGLGCAVAAVGAGVAAASHQQALDGSHALLGSYTSTQGQRVLDSFNVATYPGERDALRDAGIDVAKLGLVFVAGKYIPKALASAEGKTTTTGPVVSGANGGSGRGGSSYYVGMNCDRCNCVRIEGTTCC